MKTITKTIKHESEKGYGRGSKATCNRLAKQLHDYFNEDIEFYGPRELNASDHSYVRYGTVLHEFETMRDAAGFLFELDDILTEAEFDLEDAKLIVEKTTEHINQSSLFDFFGGNLDYLLHEIPTILMETAHGLKDDGEKTPLQDECELVEIWHMILDRIYDEGGDATDSKTFCHALYSFEH